MNYQVDQDVIDAIVTELGSLVAEDESIKRELLRLQHEVGELKARSIMTEAEFAQIRTDADRIRLTLADIRADEAQHRADEAQHRADEAQRRADHVQVEADQLQKMADLTRAEDEANQEDSQS